jgi:hypothetical protein
MDHTKSPFATIESALQFFELLDTAVSEAADDVARDVTNSTAVDNVRRIEALQLVAYKLERLDSHVGSCRRLLNDLRTLRRLLHGERGEQASSVTA